MAYSDDEETDDSTFAERYVNFGASSSPRDALRGMGQVAGSLSAIEAEYIDIGRMISGSHSPSPTISGTWHDPDDANEDLAECIAAWQESQGSSAGQRTPFMKYRSSANSSSPEHSSREHFRQGRSYEVFGPALTLNVGGVLFRTTTTTLQKAPFFESMLRHTGEGGLGASMDSEGHYFVDRSGFIFKFVLEYLRTGHWLLGEQAADVEFLEAIREEASFYGLDDRHRPAPRIQEYVAIWQFRDDTALYVDCLEQTIREDPDHQGLFRLCKYSGGLPLDQQSCSKRFKATSHCVQSVISYFGMRGFSLRHVVESSMITHITSADGQSKSGEGMQFLLARNIIFPVAFEVPSVPLSHRA